MGVSEPLSIGMNLQMLILQCVDDGMSVNRLLLYSRFLTSFLCISIPLCPQLPVGVQQSHHHLSNHVIFKFFLFFNLPFILPSVIPCVSPPCLKTRSIHRCFLCQREFSICLSSFTLLRTLSSHLIFTILL